MQVLGTCDTYTAPVAVFQSLKTAGHYKTLNVKNTLSALMYINSDIKGSNSVYTLLMMHAIYRQADEPGI